MSTRPANPPLPMQPAPDPVDRELAPLLSAAFDPVWADTSMPAPAAQAMRSRLHERLAASRRAETGMVTTRRKQAPVLPLADGVTVQTLYRAQYPDALRPGEPLRALLIELAPGARLPADLTQQALHREWLVVAGNADADGDALSQRDYRVAPAGQATPAWSSADGALLFLRESPLDATAGGAPRTVRDAEAGWQDFGPGVRRRVLWQHAGQAALLYHAEPGAIVPHHAHGHDEECLMVQGELFLDDVLLQTGDYQLAPAGSGHHTTATDTGVVIYAHGDLELQFVA